MKPNLHWKKSKAEALFAVQADGLRSAIHISNHHRRSGGHHGEGSSVQQQRKEEAEADKNKKKGAEAPSPFAGMHSQVKLGTSYMSQYGKKH